MARRSLIQAAATLICNPAVWNFAAGAVSRSPLKRACAPGLNCYSCPAAVASCPLGALQVSLAVGRFPFFAAGFLVLVGALLGRAVCAFLCPFGFFQEALFWISAKLRALFRGKTAEQKLRGLSAELSKGALSRAARAFRLAKYAFLAAFVVFLPYIGYLKSGVASPFFCALICPAGTLEAGIPLVIANPALREAAGRLFAWKAALLAAFVAASFFAFRPFCKYACPLGAIYSFFNRVALFGVQVNSEKCASCGKCTASCKMQAKAVNSAECIRCGECASVCPHGAIYAQGFFKKKGGAACKSAGCRQTEV